MESKYWIPMGIVAAFAVHYAIEKFMETSKSIHSNENCHSSNKSNQSTINQQFDDAVGKVSSKNFHLSNEERLELYGYFKQAKYGKCKNPKPSMIDLVARAKWESWNKLDTMDSNEAKQLYIQMVTKLTSTRERKKSQDSNSNSEDNFSSLGVSVSTMSMEEVDPKDWEIVENIFYYASIGAQEKVFDLLNTGLDMNSQDDEGRTILHWAVDREHLDLVDQLIDQGVDLEIKDIDGMTPLAYAVNCEYKVLTEKLINAGADCHSTDNDGESPFSQASPEFKKILLNTRTMLP